MSDLNDMLEAQRQLQINSYGKDPATLEGEERIQFIKDMHLALDDEQHEYLAETGWKPWASSRHVNRDAAVGEWIDMFHFVMNLALVLDLDAFEIYEKYMAKRAKNAKRQEQGYDGVAGKCPSCLRALDDDATKCQIDNAGRVFCSELKY
jgi:dimeric dUTPase (all-alpha-NTP-PPase superfamily)